MAMSSSAQQLSGLQMQKDWWRGGIIYQIYPRSFQDSNGDGVGDLRGIEHRLPYIASLGVDAIWISPFFTSPMLDFGYDVSDYCDIDPIFGTLADFDGMIANAHSLGIRVLIDLVISHSSNQHRWFKESRSSRTNPKSDWYVWAEPKPDGTAPSNWLSVFGGPAWQWDTGREQYYLHNFLVEQPDLNFHNPAVQDAVLNVARFWLDRGVDGFRLDTLNFYFHDEELRDNPVLPKELRTDICAPKVNPYNYQEHVYDRNRPEMIGFLNRFRSVLDEYDAAAVGEIGEGQIGLELIGQYTSGNDRMHMSYAFDMLAPDMPSAKDLAGIMNKVDQVVPDGWVCWAYSNHDCKRHASRWSLDLDAQRMMTTLMMCLRGSACIYQGEELGLTEADVAFEDLQDPYGITFWPEFKGRDGCRTPMVWEMSNTHAGFSQATRTWLPVSHDHMHNTVAEQENDPDALLHHYRRAIRFRHDHPVLMAGAQDNMHSQGDVLCFTRKHQGTEIFCAFNMSGTATDLAAPNGNWSAIAQDLGGLHPSPEGEILHLGPWQAYIAHRQT